MGLEAAISDHPTGAGSDGDYRLGFDARTRLKFHGSKISSDGGLLLFLEMHETLGLHELAGRSLRDTRTNKTGCTAVSALFVSSPLGGGPDTRMSTMRTGYRVIH